MIIKASVTEEEYQAIKQVAEKEGRTISEYVRVRLGLPEPDISLAAIIRTAKELPKGTEFTLQDIVAIIDSDEDYASRLGAIGRELNKAVEHRGDEFGLACVHTKKFVTIAGKQRLQMVYRVL